MKFAHLADCHVGSWRDPRLKDISTKAFTMAINTCIKKQVDFIIIAGDLFNTSFPRLDSLKSVTGKLRELKEKDIGVYIVPGSHDYSPSGKTILDVLEEAGLFINVFKGSIEDNKLKLNFTIDKKTGTKLTGILGKRGTLEKAYYENLHTKHLEEEKGYKIFIFHSAIDELKPKEMENVISQPISLLPKNFDYYAGGHVHIVENKKLENYGTLAYPGPLFPNSFSELEKLESGGFYIIEDDNLTWEPIQVHNVYKIKIDCTSLTPEQVTQKIYDQIEKKEFIDTIVLIRLHGKLDGKPSDINFRTIFGKIYNKSAYFVMRSTTQLTSKDFEEIKLDVSNVENIEESLIKEHLGQHEIEDEENLIKNLIKTLDSEKDESERNQDFENRIKGELNKVLNLEL